MLRFLRVAWEQQGQQGEPELHLKECCPAPGAVRCGGSAPKVVGSVVWKGQSSSRKIRCSSPWG